MLPVLGLLRGTNPSFLSLESCFAIVSFAPDHEALRTPCMRASVDTAAPIIHGIHPIIAPTQVPVTRAVFSRPCRIHPDCDCHVLRSIVAPITSERVIVL